VNMDFFILMKSELILTVIIFILLILKIGEGIRDNAVLMHIANGLLLLNFIAGFFMNREGALFSGMFVTNDVLSLEKNILNFGTLLVSLQAFDWLKNHKHLLEFYLLLLSTLLGMFFMISSQNFLMFYLGLELSAIPLAALVNFDLERPRSSEAAFKMIISSAFASAISLFGISLLYGTTGTLDFAYMADYLHGSELQLFAFIMVFAGFAFKLSAVPFHLWTADVYEGAPAPITAYLSVISKAAMVFVLITVLGGLFRDLEGMWYNVLYLSIIVTIVVGNLFAIRQQNIKRFLAFSSITQVGYILLGLSAGNETGFSSAIYFLIVYLFSNLAAFGVVTLVSAATGKEGIDDYKGFYSTNPMLALVMALALFSLAGIPPTAGFFGKMFLVTAGAGKGNYLLIAIAALNMVVSLYYYLRVVKAMFVDKSESPIAKLEGSLMSGLSLAICMAGIIVTGFVSGLFEYIVSLFIKV